MFMVIFPEHNESFFGIFIRPYVDYVYLLDYVIRLLLLAGLETVLLKLLS